MDSGGCPDIRVDLNNVVQFPQNTFLNNEQNKSQLISFIAENLKKAGHNVEICSGDADTQIVSWAIDKAITGDSVRVRVDDTDVIIMLLYFYNDDMGPIITQSEY